jgi:hypothetical protein
MDEIFKFTNEGVFKNILLKNNRLNVNNSKQTVDRDPSFSRKSSTRSTFDSKLLNKYGGNNNKDNTKLS